MDKGSAQQALQRAPTRQSPDKLSTMTTRTRRRSPAHARSHHPHSPPLRAPASPDSPFFTLLLFFSLSFDSLSPHPHLFVPSLPYLMLFISLYFILFFAISFYSPIIPTSLFACVLILYTYLTPYTTHYYCTYYPTRATTPTTHLTPPPVRPTGIHHSTPASAARGH